MLHPQGQIEEKIVREREERKLRELKRQERNREHK